MFKKKNSNYSIKDMQVLHQLQTIPSVKEAVKYFSLVKNEVSDLAYWTIVKNLYVNRSEGMLDEWATLLSSTRTLKRQWIMNKQEQEMLRKIAFFQKVYQVPLMEDYFSYYINSSDALKVAQACGKNIIVEYEIKKSDIWACFENREIICFSKGKKIRDHYLISKNMMISPHMPTDGGVVCMPRKANVPIPKDTSWKLTTCSECGEECWETPLIKKTLMESHAKALCTACALKL